MHMVQYRFSECTNQNKDNIGGTEMKYALSLKIKGQFLQVSAQFTLFRSNAVFNFTFT